ncbi:Transcription factor, fungi [Penicillium expansum]|uniref:Transcription factor, fungi n=1 Tax=Penicillium expansum TaxID=27334 RepID=A0A0A2IQU8_PENEN|nr:Transcription factor, fungi [Penicillium expansum]KGO44871.1 Transcription factor, fungi [Penicillium expansum]KGO52681.1 Transcription factor, fungi [Penicillium expansum]
MTLSVDDNESVTRQYIGDLEQRVKSLENELAAARRIGHASREPSAPAGPSDSQDHREHSPNFIEGGGISFMRHLFADSEWREHDPSLLQNFSKGSGPAEAGVRAALLPPPDEARLIFDKYLNGSHVQNPFLLRREVQSIYSKVFLSTSEDKQGKASERDAKQSFFRAFMILAIGSVLPYRNGEFEHHPYGYYLSALKYFDDSFLSGGLASIQDLLLVSRFAIYHYVGTSIWEVTRLGMRMCIEQDLHKAIHSSRKIGLLQEQLQRRVFWQCYMIDRYSSITLIRPFAIRDKYIQIGLPVDANDEEIEAAERSGAFSDLDSLGSMSSLTSVTTRITEMSIFFACLRLRQISAQIHREFGGKEIRRAMQSDTTARGVIYSSLDKLLKELDQWRSSTPVFHNPQSLYQMPEWYDLLCLRERLLLVRKAIDIVPKRDNIPPRDLLSLCLECAFGAITGYCQLLELKKITFTRSYFQMLFTAGLSVMFCLSVVKDFDPQTIQKSTDAVIMGENAMKKMSEELPDAKRYVAVYEALRWYVIRKYGRPLQVECSNSHPSLEVNNAHSRSLAPALMVDPKACHGQADGRPHLDQPEILSTGASVSPGLHVHSSLHATLIEPAFTHGNVRTQDGTNLSEGSILSWDIFEDNTLWNMEAGLNEYAYGDPPMSLYFDGMFDLI